MLPPALLLDADGQTDDVVDRRRQLGALLFFGQLAARGRGLGCDQRGSGQSPTSASPEHVRVLQPVRRQRHSRPSRPNVEHSTGAGRADAFVDGVAFVAPRGRRRSPEATSGCFFEGAGATASALAQCFSMRSGNVSTPVKIKKASKGDMAAPGVRRKPDHPAGDGRTRNRRTSRPGPCRCSWRSARSASGPCCRIWTSRDGAAIHDDAADGVPGVLP